MHYLYVLLLLIAPLCVYSGNSTVSGLDDPSSSESGSTAGFVVGIIAMIVGNVVFVILSFKHVRSAREPSVAPAPKPATAAQLTRRVSEGMSAAVTELQRIGEEDEGLSDGRLDARDIAVGNLIGAGITGAVYECKWRGLGVAVKQISFAPKHELTVREHVAALMRLRHPHLALIMGVAFPTPSEVWIASEILRPGSLFSALQDPSLKLEWPRRLSIALDVARGLSYLHGCDPPIVHGGLHSANILLDGELNAKISDAHMAALRAVSKTAARCLQPYWTAPELLYSSPVAASTGSGSRSATVPSDVYSLGVVLWELLTRRQPFDHFTSRSSSSSSSNSSVNIAQQIVQGSRPELPSNCPQKLAELIQACWRPDSAQRPRTSQIMSELIAMEMQRLAVPESLSVRVQRPPLPLPAPSLAIDAAAHVTAPWVIPHEDVVLEKILGYGSFGEVWRAAFRGQPVAVKRLALRDRLSRSSSISASSQRAALIKEASLLSSLRHPNVVLFMGATLVPGQEGLVMELCEKGNLYDLVHDHSQPIDYNRIIQILLDVVSGVTYLHAHQPPILHRDLKSLNILVDSQWRGKVADFGLAELKGAAQGDTVQLGTPFWSAPETMELMQFTEQSEVYSLGMIMWELFSRQTPFQGMNPHQAALSVVLEDRRPVIPPFVPQGFRSLIESCWSRDPFRRPALPQITQALTELQRTGLPRIELNLSNAQVYRKKALVNAFRSKDVVIVSKSWGTGQSKPFDWIIVSPGDDVYTCDAKVFHKTYRQMPQHPLLHRKIGKILAREMPDDFLMASLEGMEHGKKGDFLAQNPAYGDQWPIERSKFFELYEASPTQSLEDDPYPGERVPAPPIDLEQPTAGFAALESKAT